MTRLILVAFLLPLLSACTGFAKTWHDTTTTTTTVDDTAHPLMTPICGNFLANLADAEAKTYPSSYGL